MGLFERAPLFARLAHLSLEERRKLERVFVDGAGGAPLSVGCGAGQVVQAPNTSVCGFAGRLTPCAHRVDQ
jgi:hypothetical protein